MRILMIAPMVPWADAPGAIPMLLHGQLTALSERHEVTVVAGVGDEPGEREAAQALIDQGVDLRAVDRGLPVSALERWRRRRRLAWGWLSTGRPWRTVWFATPGVQLVIDELAGAAPPFDVVAVEDSSMALYRLPAGVPAVLTEHEVRVPRASRRRAAGPRSILRELDWRRWSSFQRRAWRRYARLQVFSERDARAVADLAPEVSRWIRVNPFGIAIPPASDPASEQPDSLLFVGNFTHAPNRDAALWLAREIHPQIRASHPHAKLLIVGSSPPREVLELAVPGVEVLADVPAIEPYIASAAVVVAPLRIGGGMRMKVLLGLASGKAVVTTTRGTEGFLVETGGALPPFLVADETEAFAAAVAGLLADGVRRRELGARARVFVERHHSLSAWGARLEAVYCEAREEASPCASSS